MVRIVICLLIQLNHQGEASVGREQRGGVVVVVVVVVVGLRERERDQGTQHE